MHEKITQAMTNADIPRLRRGERMRNITTKDVEDMLRALARDRQWREWVLMECWRLDGKNNVSEKAGTLSDKDRLA